MRVMCVGASITMGEGVNGGYRLPLEKMGEGAGIPLEFVGRADSNSVGMTSPYHDGYGGLRLDQVEEGVPGTCQPIAEGVRALQPDVALILCGTNDVRQNHALSAAPQRLGRLISVIQSAAPQVRVFVSSLPPDRHYDDAIRRYNAAVAQLVVERAARGQKVAFVDNYAALNPGIDISPDLTHPNQSGYIKIARGWFNALAPGAPQIAFALPNGGGTPFTAHGCVGYQITMKSAALVTHLGIHCAGQSLDAPHAVGVFDGAGQCLARTEIAPSRAPSGQFVYQELPMPLELEAGQSYYFVSNSVGLPALIGANAIIDPLCFENPRFYFDHNVAIEMPHEHSLSLKFPISSIHDLDGGLGYFGPNFRLAPQEG